ncbi:MAG: CoA transferase [Acidobacteriota bacterium]|nr:CoA transferase [Acidobacteriota bacterium]
MSALKGIRVVELAEGIAGPYCGKLFADLGADVIKVEAPTGDPSRAVGPFADGQPDPETSAAYLYNNTSKRSIRLDLAAEVALVRRLIESADVVIVGLGQGTLAGHGLDWSDLEAGCPGLVYTSLTPYGRTGPRAHVPGGELTLTHAGGLGSTLPTRSENIDRAPVKLGGDVMAHVAGVIAALATASAVLGRNRTGHGRLVDVSMQEVVLSMVAPLVPGPRYQGLSWSRVPDRPPAMGRLETRDGYVILSAFDDHHFDAFRTLMGDPEWCQGDEWRSMEYRANHFMDVGHLIDEWMLGQEKDEIHHRAAKMGIPIGPISNAAEVMANPQFAERGYFSEVDHPATGKRRYAGVPYILPASPAELGRAPLLGEHDDEIRAEANGAPGPERAPVAPGPPGLPLQGVRVAEFCWVWAGPYAGMLLSSLGAEVIKVEGHRRTDLTRRSVVWPLPEPAPNLLPPNEGMAFNSVNMNKQSLALDLSKPEGGDIARRLIASCDVVVDNMRPGAMTKLGLGYEALKEVRDGLVVASSSGRGHIGAERNYLGFAPVHQGIGGGAYITGYPDDHPCHSGGDIDLMNAITVAFAIVAALHHRDATGDGQFIDYSQCEGVSSLLGDVLLGSELDGNLPERIGNRHPAAAPHGVYRAWGVDRWLAIEVHDDAAFHRLAEAIEAPGLADDVRFASVKARKENEDALDEILEAFTSRRDRDRTVARLEAAGVAVAPVRDSRDLYADRHLRERGAFATVEHPDLGALKLVRAPFVLGDTQLARSVAPALGRDNEEILTGLVGLDLAEIEALRDKDILP